MPHAKIPTFSLYGETPSPVAFGLHIETLAARSGRHDWRIGAHLHRGLHQMLWIAEGPVRAVLGAGETVGMGPLAIIIPPGVAHSFSFSPQTAGYVLTFDPRALLEGEGGASGMFANLFATSRVVSMRDDLAAAQRLTGLLADLAVECAAPDAAFSPAPLWLARAALWRLAKLAGAIRPARGGRTTFLRFAALVEAHFHEGWPITIYADKLALSVKRLNRLTQREAGMTAMACVRRRLLREACERLVHLDAAVGDIGLDLGFEDPAYFTRFFKRMTGESPRAFRDARRTGAP